MQVHLAPSSVSCRCLSPDPHFRLVDPEFPCHQPPTLSQTPSRNTQLDGWRGLSIIAVIAIHWLPYPWRKLIPCEIGLFFFLTLTGVLITAGLLRDRDRHQGSPSWQKIAYLQFLRRRASRLIIPCYVAILSAAILQSPDLVAHPIPYLAQFSNIHIAFLPEWPYVTSHFWTLAVQIQFYLLWPFLIYLLPQRFLIPALLIIACLAPLTRALCTFFFPQVHHIGALTTACLDYLSIGACLAVLLHRGIAPSHPAIRRTGQICAVIYAVLYLFETHAQPLPILSFFQQTTLSFALSALIATTLHGIPHRLGRFLNHPTLQAVGRLSYGLYLFHNLVPYLLGYLAPILWDPIFDGPLIIIRLTIFTLTSWLFAYLSWRFLEKGANRITPNTQAP